MTSRIKIRIALLTLLAAHTFCTNAPAATSMAERADFWSFKPVLRPLAPALRNPAWVRNPIDAFILARLEKENLKPSAEADRHTLIRRVSFDLIGLPPTPEEADAFAADPDPDAYEKLVDRLLASPRYGERWGRHWLDIVRFAETHGFEENQPRPNAWPYRDYVIRAFNSDLPYDRFVHEQLCGDAMGVDEATGYLVAGADDQVKSPDPVLTAQQRADELHDMVSTTGSTFLGLTVGCARCHDHKFDAITQVDYYRMTAILAGVQHGDRAWRREGDPKPQPQLAELRRRMDAIDALLDGLAPLAVPGRPPGSQSRPPVSIARNIDRFARIEARFLRFTIAATNNGSEPCIDELEIYSAGENARNVALASAGAKVTVSGTISGFSIHKVEHLIDGQYGNAHSWISNQAGAGWVQIELPQKMLIDRVVWGRDREQRFADRLPTSYKIEVATDPGNWRLVATSEDRAAASGPIGAAPVAPENSPPAAALLKERRAIETQLQTSSPSSQMIYGGNFTNPPQTHRLQRGDPMQPKEMVIPGGIAAVVPALDLGADASDRDRRTALADWITNPANPLPARVIVNRLWHYHFGRGIVSTPGDFGHMGARPTHPELIDWMASELLANGWRLKSIQRLIVCSATYRQSSAPNSSGLAADFGSTLLWRFPPRRLEAEPIRDSILFVTGKLDLAMGGPGFDVFKPDSNYVRVWSPKDQFGPTEWRRMVYQFKPRLQQEPTFGVFDCPDGGQIAPRRSSSTTPLQALNLMNSPFMMQQANFFADRLHQEAGDDPGADTARAFRLAFGRNPSDSERAESVKFIHDQGLVLFCRTLLNANEFLHVF